MAGRGGMGACRLSIRNDVASLSTAQRSSSNSQSSKAVAGQTLAGDETQSSEATSVVSKLDGSIVLAIGNRNDDQYWHRRLHPETVRILRLLPHIGILRTVAVVSTQFPTIRFRGQLRPSQADVVEIARRKLADGRRRLHIVAPPGSGKTVLGLYLWAECIRQPAVVLSPNSAIQAQWAARTDLFQVELPGDEVVSTSPERPALLNSLTYQSVTLPGRGTADADEQAIDLWQDKLIEADQAKDPDEALVWIQDLKRHNPDYYKQRLGAYRKQIRDAAALAGGSLDMLHRSSLGTLNRLKEQRIGLIILDECHHLMGHWGRVLADAHDLLERPMVVGLTATPPDRDGKKPEDIARYDGFFGEIDYEVPVPAVVKDGFLAPYQDLAYFVRPTRKELSFVANADDQLHEIVEDLCRPLPEDVKESASLRRQPPVPSAGSRPPLASQGSEDCGMERGINEDNETAAERPTKPNCNQDVQRQRRDDLGTPIPARSSRAVPSASPSPQPSISPAFAATGEPLSDWLITVLGELRLPTGVQKDWQTFERRDPVFAEAARIFLLRRGHSLPPDTPPPEMDLEPEEMPEMEILTPVLDRYVRHHLRRSEKSEDRELAERVIRRLRTLGVQITETGSQACASPVGRVMAYSHSKTAALAPVLAAEHRILGDTLRAVVVADYEKTSAVTADVKHLLDSEAGGAIAAFKQLIRHPEMDSLDPILVTGSSVLVDDDLASKFDQAAEQWLAAAGHDVELSFGEEEGFHIINGKGGDWCPRVYVAMITDLFQRGLTKCLVGTRGLLGEGWDANKINVLVDLTTVTTSMTVNQLRGRSIRLDPDEPTKLANNWDVVCIAPEFTKGLDDYKRFIAKHKTIFGVTDDGAIEKGVGHVHAAFTDLRPEGLEGSTNVLNADMLGRVGLRTETRSLWRIGEPYSPEPIRALETNSLGGGGGFPPFKHSRAPWSDGSLAQAIGEVVLASLHDAGLLPRRRHVHVGNRSGGYVRVFLEKADEEENAVFTQALHEALGPLHRPRYVIARYVDNVKDTWLSSILPSIVGRYFQRRDRRRVMLHAVPSVLAKNKDLADIYQSHWNRRVSPGEALYAYRGAGKELIAEARSRGQVPKGCIHEKEIFM